MLLMRWMTQCVNSGNPSQSCQAVGLLCANSQRAVYSFPQSRLVLKSGLQHQSVVWRNGDEGGRGVQLTSVAPWQHQEGRESERRCDVSCNKLMWLLVLFLNSSHLTFFAKSSEDGALCTTHMSHVYTHQTFESTKEEVPPKILPLFSLGQLLVRQVVFFPSAVWPRYADTKTQGPNRV